MVPFPHSLPVSNLKHCNRKDSLCKRLFDLVRTTQLGSTVLAGRNADGYLNLHANGGWSPTVQRS